MMMDGKADEMISRLKVDLTSISFNNSTMGIFHHSEGRLHETYAYPRFQRRDHKLIIIACSRMPSLKRIPRPQEYHGKTILQAALLDSVLSQNASEQVSSNLS